MGDKSNRQVGRVGVYVDGFNLYHGLRDLAGRGLLWLDLARLARGFLKPGQSLESVAYFTAPVRNDAAALIRQKTYNLALESTGVRVVHGHFQEQCRRCRVCGATWRTYEEKRSDVAIAAAMVADVALARVDVVLLVSADSDLCAAIEAIRGVDANRNGKTKVVSVFPPNRRSDLLREMSDAWLPLGRAVVRRCQLPGEVGGRDGAIYHRPPYWN